VLLCKQLHRGAHYELSRVFCVIPLRASTALRLCAWFVGERQLFSCAKPARSGGRNHSSTACAGQRLDARLLELERRRIRLGAWPVRRGAISWCCMDRWWVGSARTSLDLGGRAVAAQVRPKAAYGGRETNRTSSFCSTTDPMTASSKWNEIECQNVTKHALSDGSRVTPISKLSDLRVNSTCRRPAAPEGPDGY
jgi:hypothetical protein